jgi:hypothetical protein
MRLLRKCDARLSRRFWCALLGKCSHRFCSRSQYKAGICQHHYAGMIGNTCAIFDVLWPNDRQTLKERRAR